MTDTAWRLRPHQRHRAQRPAAVSWLYQPRWMLGRGLSVIACVSDKAGGRCCCEAEFGDGQEIVGPRTIERVISGGPG